MYFVSDNASRFILNHKIDQKVSWETNKNLIFEAYAKYGNNSHSIELVTDGGPENIANEFKSAVKSLSINPLIALKDITFSNNAAESKHRVLKYGYFYRHSFQDAAELEKFAEKAVFEYNHIRPHCALQGRTPYEAFMGIQIDKDALLLKKQEAKRLRIEQNRKDRCDKCPKLP